MGIGEYLQEVRNNKGWTIREAARRSGISSSRIEEIEHSRSKATGKPTSPTLDLLRKLANAYDLPLTLLLEKAGIVPSQLDDHLEIELLQVFRRLSTRNKELGIGLLRTVLTSQTGGEEASPSTDL